MKKCDMLKANIACSRKLLLVGTAVFGLQSSPVLAQAVTPFQCTTDAYGVINNPSEIVILDPITRSNTSRRDVSPSQLVNGIGYNVLDNFAYGLNEDREIIRIDVNGNTTNLGIPTGPGTFNPITVSGTFDAAGNYYVIRGSAIFIVDVGNTPAAGSLTYTTIARSGVSGNPLDIAFSNVDGNLYGLRGGNLVRLNSSTGLVSNVTTTGDALTGNAGGVWSTSDGTVFLYNNSSGILFSADISATVPVITRIGDVESNGQFDAFSCLPPTLTKQASVATSPLGASYSYTYEIFNALANPISVNFDDVLPSEVTFVAGSVSPAAPGSGTVTTFDDDTLRISSLIIPGNGSLTFTADVTVDSGLASGTNIDNQASITFGGVTLLSDDPSTAPLIDPARVVVSGSAAAPSLSLTKVADDATLRTVGETIIYTYTVTNTGDQLIRDVTVSDTHNASDPAPTPEDEVLLTDVAPLGDSIDAAQNGSWDELGPGDVITFTGEYTLTQDDIDNLE